METFNILKQKLTFDDDLIKYMNIYNAKENWINEYTKKYNSLNNKVNSLDELYAYINNNKDFIISECTLIAEKLLDIFVQNQIYDKSTKDIISNNESVQQLDVLISNINKQINNYLNISNKKLEQAKVEAAEDAQNAYFEYYTNVISTSAWDVIVAETFNDLEATRVAKKRQRYYDKQARLLERSTARDINNMAQHFQVQIQGAFYKGGILIIEEMFLFCLKILISNNKLSSLVLENLQSEKAENILNNINRIQDNNVINEQLIIALMANPFSSDIHTKLLDIIQSTQDISEYIRFIKFIHFENNVLGICENKCTNLENEQDKYVKIINAIDENYIANVISKANTIEDIENSNPSEQLSISKKIFYMNYDKVYDTFLYASNTLGKILEQDKSKGHIVVNLNNVLNPVATDIKIIKQNVIETVVEISSFCKTDGLSVIKTSFKWKEKLLEEVYKKLDFHKEEHNEESEQYEQQKKLYNKRKIKNTSRKILLIVLIPFTLLGLLIGGLPGIIMLDFCVSIMLYPIIYLCVYINYKDEPYLLKNKK